MPTKADNGEKLKLTPQQELAVDLLATGQTITQTAEAVNVSRQTVSEWVNHHAAFQAELNKRRQELWQAHADRLRSLVPKALDVIERELDGENSLRAAAHILRAAGLNNMPKPYGPTETEDIEIATKLRESERMLDSMGLF
jgi:hypothetical protein